jgi:predicted aldo/keto reductase-like oxidoreductase
VDIPQCFSYLNNGAIFGDWQTPKNSYHALLDDSRGGGRKAGVCVECGECEPKCPQNIPIREKLKEVVAAFETN